ncbi:MAG: preprotein translocase subunit SecA [Epsilonproteobacteria bacterium]|nr:preprotein translocase subunit SecA [Campylobacterota bacterium]NPA64844.1 preprotein translocase subunit SecA [Campylobacterota bacterium]
MVKGIVKKVFGTKNDRELKRYQKRVKKINALEPKYEKMSDEELKAAFDELRQQVKSGQKSMDDVLEDSFAITREASKRVLGMRHYDVQLIGGMVLHEGKIAEMKTGEGKTLVATLAVALNAMSGEGVHVVTVNDYLAKRDATEMGKLYEFLGYSTGCITSQIHDDHERKKQYDCDITYGTNNEFGFDYLRDNMKYSKDEIVQRGHNYAIVDEVDSILIDEARTPLIISGPTNRKLDSYIKADQIAKQLQKDKHFTVDEKDRVILLTQEGIAKAEELFGVDNLYSLENAILAHHLDQALKANYLFQKDVDYVVKNGEVVIVDEFTGRLSEGRRFSEGLHQALEAKEGVQIQEESQTLADITFQNYFRLYKKLAGMTGTAQTEATEFAEIYGLEVISIPTNKPVIRKDHDDLIFKTEKEKFDAVVKKIKELHKKGQPVLVGTTSIEKNELLHQLLKKEKIPHTILNAKHHEKEAQIIAQAGKKGAVTVATNMAGRGVDIKIDDEVRKLGGLFILGTERHESRRIDNQLRGRSGRQGDPGESQFFLSLEDNLLRIFGGERIKNIMDRLGIEEGEHIESKMVTRAVEKAQKKVENLHFESRKHILEYDDVANEQRKTIYKFRQELLNPDYDISKKIEENRADVLEQLFAEAQIYPESPKEDYDLSKLMKLLREEFGAVFEIEELKDKEYDDLFAYVLGRLKEEYEAKMGVLDPKQRAEIERILYLQVLDNAWREHLYQMDILKTGIGLRGYNQKDPLVEYKKESYNLFVELVNRIKKEAIKTLHLVQLRSEEEEEEIRKLEQELAKMEEQIKQEAVLQHANEEQTSSQLPGKKPARNEPCPCGSGKKYKHCCGKSGPKKGLLASSNG